MKKTAEKKEAPKKAAAKTKPRAEKQAEQDHGHGHDHEHDEDGNCCGENHLLCEMRIRQYEPKDYRSLRAIWKAGDIVLDETDTAKALDKNLKENKKGCRIFVAEAQM